LSLVLALLSEGTNSSTWLKIFCGGHHSVSRWTSPSLGIREREGYLKVSCVLVNLRGALVVLFRIVNQQMHISQETLKFAKVGIRAQLLSYLIQGNRLFDSFIIIWEDLAAREIKEELGQLAAPGDGGKDRIIADTKSSPKVVGAGVEDNERAVLFVIGEQDPLQGLPHEGGVGDARIEGGGILNNVRLEPQSTPPLDIGENLLHGDRILRNLRVWLVEILGILKNQVDPVEELLKGVELSLVQPLPDDAEAQGILHHLVIFRVLGPRGEIHEFLGTFVATSRQKKKKKKKKKKK